MNNEQAALAFVQKRREEHDKLGHEPTSDFAYCAEPDGISACVCDDGRWLRALDNLMRLALSTPSSTDVRRE